MNSIKLGIIREEKVPVDKRVPFTPQQARKIMLTYPLVNVVCQTSPFRCFSDKEYLEQGIEVVDDVSDCDILMGIKEVRVSDLIANKTYFFFSHTIKQQPHNRELLRTILKKDIKLIDYEVLKDNHGNRLVAFGRYAGIVGTYNGLWTYGKRYKLFDIKRAYDTYDYDDLKSQFSRIKLPAIKIVLTGGGRVGNGAMEVLNALGVKKVRASDFLDKKFNEPVYIQLNSEDYHVHKNNTIFDRKEFHLHPERYKSNFLQFACTADILIAGAYWNPQAPLLFTKEDMRNPSFKISVIADISCDINGSIPATIKATNVDDPIYDYDPFTETTNPPLMDEKSITVMAIDNLPCELPRSASEDFGNDLLERVVPALLKEDSQKIIERATITSEGKLTENFSYLKDYVS